MGGVDGGVDDISCLLKDDDGVKVACESDKFRIAFREESLIVSPKTRFHTTFAMSEIYDTYLHSQHPLPISQFYQQP